MMRSAASTALALVILGTACAGDCPPLAPPSIDAADIEAHLDTHLEGLDAAGRERLRAKLDEMEPRRTDVIAGDTAPLTLVGPDLAVGQIAPDFTAAGVDGKPVSVHDYRGKILVVSVVPSIDTPVCEAQTGHFAAVKDLPDDVAIITVSRDQIPAQKRFLETSTLAMTMASDARDRQIGALWGLEVAESGLLARSVFVLDREGKVVYREIVANQTTEPTYDAALAAAREAAARGAPH